MIPVAIVATLPRNPPTAFSADPANPRGAVKSWAPRPIRSRAVLNRRESFSKAPKPSTTTRTPTRSNAMLAFLGHHTGMLNLGIATVECHELTQSVMGHFTASEGIGKIQPLDKIIASFDPVIVLFMPRDISGDLLAGSNSGLDRFGR